jgi:hypothetical protein
MIDFLATLSPVILLMLYVLASLLFLTIASFVLRFYLHRTVNKTRAFHMEVLRITVPKEGQEDGNEQWTQDTIKQKIAVAETFFSTLGGMQPQTGWSAFWFGRSDQFSLEIVADKDGLVTFYAAVPKFLRQYFEQQLHAQYESAEITSVEDYNIFDARGEIVTSNITLKKSYIFQIQTYDRLETDPISSLTNVLSKFEKHEGAAIQYILRPAKAKWHKEPARVAREMQQGKKIGNITSRFNNTTVGWFLKEFYFQIVSQGEHKKGEIDSNTGRDYRLSPAEEEVVKLLEEKTSKSGFDVNIRVVVSAASKELASLKLSNIVNAFSQYSGYEYGNQFVASKPSIDKRAIDAFIYRKFVKRGSYVLNTKEMASLWHLPLAITDTPNIRWLIAKKSAPPPNMPKEGVIIGAVKYRGVDTPVRIKRADRRRHMYIIGKSGSGKSVLMTQMAIQDIQNGEGIAVIDPHGELVEDILQHIPKERADDVVIFDPSDTERPMGLNMLEYDTDEQRDFAVQEMIAIFYKMFGEEMIGPMFEHYMRNAMLAMMEDREAGATLIEVPRMFTDTEFRKDKLKFVTNQIVKNFWEQEYEQSQQGQQAADMLSYVISKIGRFLTNDMMRNIIGQSKSAFNIREIMDNQKILLVNLSKGKTGEVNSSLLGFIMVSKIQMAAMARADMKKEDRKDFYLYVDEFQNFTTDSIATILSEARKYMLDLILAHQYVAQLTKGNDSKIRDAVFGNVGTMAAFRVGAEDAEFLEKEFSPVFDQNDIINVDQYTANIKLLIDNTASRPFNMATILPPEGNHEMIALLKELSRMKYGRRRDEVEKEIRTRAKWDDLKGGSSFVGPDAFI